jgi:PAS domain S-box-containing protein
VVVGGAIFVRRGDGRIRVEDDLAGKSVIVIRSDLAHDYAVTKGWAERLVFVDTAETGLRLLAGGQHDAMLISKLAGMQTIRNQRIGGVEPLETRVGFSQRFAFAVRKGNTDLLSRINEGMALAKANGVYDQLYERWFGVYEVRSLGWRELWPSAIGVALIAGLAWLVAFRRRLRLDRRNAANLRDSEARWKFALEGAGDGVWDADLPSGTALYSRRWKEILGYRDDEIGNSSEEWSRRIHPDDLPSVMHENQACIDGRSDQFVAEFRMRAKDGRWVWILDRGRVVDRSPDGKALRMIGTHTDISARKATEAHEAARAQVMMQIATGESLPPILESIVRVLESRCDWRCSVLLVEPGGQSLSVGAAPSLPEHFNRGIHGMSIVSGDGPCALAVRSGDRVVCEDALADPRWPRWRDLAKQAGLRACWAEPIRGANGIVLGALASYHDRPRAPSSSEIHTIVEAAQVASIAIERKRSEQALRDSEARLSEQSRTLQATLERMEQGVMMVGTDQVVEVCNRRAIELLDLPPALMASRPRFADVLAYQWSTDEFAHTPEDLRQFVRAGGILDEPQRYERRRPNGLVIEVQSVPIAGGGVLRTYTDITDRQRAEATRLVLEAQLLEARKLEAIGTLAGGIAHDFNNILAAILGNVALARDAVDAGHPAQQFLEQIGKAGQRARSLVQQILAFSRQQPAEFVPVTLRGLVEETVTMLRSTAGPAVTLRLVVSDARLVVQGNPTQLQQVLMNLGTNALHALRDGAGHIEIGLAQGDVSGEAASPSTASTAPFGHAHLWVADDGVGMSDETRQRIFEPFFTTKPVGQGTGLGLAVAHGIVETHGGRIEVTSAVGRGSRFDLYLPLIDQDSAPAPLDAITLGPARGRGQHVLYVDDDEVMALMVQSLLQRLGYRVTVSPGAREAIEVVTAAPDDFDLVVTDFNMPKHSGLDVVRGLAGIRPSLPVVIISGYVSEELRANASALGVRAVMQKEHTLEELGTLVHEVLQR